MTKEAAKERIESLFRGRWDKNDLIEIALQIEGEEDKRTIKEVLEISSHIVGLKEDDLMRKGKGSRFPENVLGRALCYHYLRGCGYTYQFIGRQFNNRDHATVLHSLRTLNKDLETNWQPTKDAFKRFYSIINA